MVQLEPRRPPLVIGGDEFQAWLVIKQKRGVNLTTPAALGQAYNPSSSSFMDFWGAVGRLVGGKGGGRALNISKLPPRGSESLGRLHR
jgi:hypothetical protein